MDQVFACWLLLVSAMLPPETSCSQLDEPLPLLSPAELLDQGWRRSGKFLYKVRHMLQQFLSVNASIAAERLFLQGLSCKHLAWQLLPVPAHPLCW